MADWPLKHDGPCACRFVRREEFEEAEQVEWCGLHAKQRDELEAVKKERDMWKDTSVRDAKRVDELVEQLAAANARLAKIDALEPVGYMDGRGRFFYANDPWMKENHVGMPPLYLLDGIKE